MPGDELRTTPDAKVIEGLEQAVAHVRDRAIDFNDVCFFCLHELSHGVPDNGKCEHELLREWMRLWRGRG